ncbi:MAG: serine/threonine-protein kinase [Kofleriaceae bacterium]
MAPSDDPTQAARAPRAPGLLEAGALVGEYRIERMVGKGGMGEVYAAVHPVIAKRAAIKVLRPELSHDPATVERFVLEARAVNEIQHPNIIDIFAFGRLEDGRHYFVMEFLGGVSLKDRLAGGPISLEEARQILIAIANALAASHAIGIVHRDLKPDNVFLVDVKDSPTRIVKLLDFGIAKLVQDDRNLDQTAAGIFIGTPIYASPEQTRGEKVDHRCDLYSFGVVAFEMLTGRVPFEGTNVAAIATKHLYEPAPSISKLAPDVPLAIADLVQALLAKDPAARPTHDEIRERLRDPAPSVPIDRPRPEPRRRGLAAVMIACLIALAVGIVIATRTTSQLPAIASPPIDAEGSAASRAASVSADAAVEPSPPPIAVEESPVDAGIVEQTTPATVVETKSVTTKKPVKRGRKKPTKKPSSEQPKDPSDPDGLL